MTTNDLINDLMPRFRHTVLACFASAPAHRLAHALNAPFLLQLGCVCDTCRWTVPMKGCKAACNCKPGTVPQASSSMLPLHLAPAQLLNTQLHTRHACHTLTLNTHRIHSTVAQLHTCIPARR